MPPIDPTPAGIRLTCHVQPRASRTECAGRHGDALKIRLAAPPVDGAANEALLRFLADRLGVSRGAVTLRAGASSRRKVVEVQGVGPETAAARLEVGGG
ncbi:MAG: DUF167 domain-containing protein [Gemmatimonadales bacterium]|nr:DUF167 domain-containing protein [Gemmatimonadales bacterium]MBP9199599.1 DUF167 domain-containing protein [Gemmatimonadales bacterium]